MQNTNQIIDRLWIGDVRASEDREFLEKENIEVIVNCTKDLPHRYEPLFTKPLPDDVIDSHFIKYFRVPCDDNGKEIEVDNFLRETYKIIDKITELYHSKKKIFVHCVAGQQRSCSFVLCLMYRLGYSKDEAFAIIMKNRPNAFNFGYEMHFKRALDEFR